MNKFVIVAALAALGACSQEPAAPAPEATETAAAAPTMADMAGTYDYTMPDGTAGVSVMTADGAYTDTEGDTVIKGTWNVTDGKTCFDPEGDDPEQATTCYAVSEPDADGGQTATADDGTVVKIKKHPAA